jgi:hypothetical protein
MTVNLRPERGVQIVIEAARSHHGPLLSVVPEAS